MKKNERLLLAIWDIDPKLVAGSHPLIVKIRRNIRAVKLILRRRKRHRERMRKKGGKD